MQSLIGTDILSFRLRNTKHKIDIPERGNPFNCFLAQGREWLMSRKVLFGFLLSVSSRELCRVQKDNLSSSFLHKSSARRVSTRSPVRDIQSYEAQYGESSRRFCMGRSRKFGSIPVNPRWTSRFNSCLSPLFKPTTGSSGVREKATLKKISTLVNLVEPLINLADFIPFQVFSIPAGTGAEITG